MKAISLWQPWATLVAIGAKRIETRGRLTHHRGPLAIHAAKRSDAEADRLCVDPGPVRDALERAGHMVETADEIRLTLPVGVIVATCVVTDCLEIVGSGSRSSFGRVTTMLPPPEPERSFGDYRLGRFAWLLSDVRPLAKPVAAKGRQGFFNVADELLAAAGVRA